MSTGDLDRDMALALVSERAVELAAPALRDLPALPREIDHLSHSSLGLLHKCPERWRRRYLLREYEPPSGNMIVGSAAGAAEGASLQRKIKTGEDLSEADILDAYADEWTQRAAQDVDWAGEKPDTIRESGRRALTAYHKLIAPRVQPVSVERKFTLRFEGCEWTFTGYLDLEEADGSVGDLKVKGKRLTRADANTDLQPSAYLLARRVEGHPASEFRFHTMLRTAKATAELVPTSRTDRQLDTFLSRIMAGAAEIAWRVGADVWDGAPAGAWWCGEKWCGYWARCPMGGAR